MTAPQPAGRDPLHRVTPTLGELQSGHILELSSGDPETLMSLPDWCAGEGHALLHQAPGDGTISYWIGKR